MKTSSAVKHSGNKTEGSSKLRIEKLLQSTNIEQIEELLTQLRRESNLSRHEKFQLGSFFLKKGDKIRAMLFWIPLRHKHSAELDSQLVSLVPEALELLKESSQINQTWTIAEITTLLAAMRDSPESFSIAASLMKSLVQRARTDCDFFTEDGLLPLLERSQALMESAWGKDKDHFLIWLKFRRYVQTGKGESQEACLSLIRSAQELSGSDSQVRALQCLASTLGSLAKERGENRFDAALVLVRLLWEQKLAGIERSEVLILALNTVAPWDVHLREESLKAWKQKMSISSEAQIKAMFCELPNDLRVALFLFSRSQPSLKSFSQPLLFGFFGVQSFQVEVPLNLSFCRLDFAEISLNEFVELQGSFRLDVWHHPAHQKILAQLFANRVRKISFESSASADWLAALIPLVQDNQMQSALKDLLPRLRLAQKLRASLIQDGAVQLLSECKLTKSSYCPANVELFFNALSDLVILEAENWLSVIDPRSIFTHFQRESIRHFFKATLSFLKDLKNQKALLKALPNQKRWVAIGQECQHAVDYGMKNGLGDLGFDGADTMAILYLSESLEKYPELNSSPLGKLIPEWSAEEETKIDLESESMLSTRSVVHWEQSPFCKLGLSPTAEKTQVMEAIFAKMREANPNLRELREAQSAILNGVTGKVYKLLWGGHLG